MHPSDVGPNMDTKKSTRRPFGRVMLFSVPIIYVVSMAGAVTLSGKQIERGSFSTDRSHINNGAPPLTLSHAWVVVTTGAPERAALEKIGFRIAPTVNRHDGQGTSSVTVELLN